MKKKRISEWWARSRVYMWTFDPRSPGKFVIKTLLPFSLRNFSYTRAGRVCWETPESEDGYAGRGEFQAQTDTRETKDIYPHLTNLWLLFVDTRKRRKLCVCVCARGKLIYIHIAPDSCFARIGIFGWLGHSTCYIRVCVSWWVGGGLLVRLKKIFYLFFFSFFFY